MHEKLMLDGSMEELSDAKKYIKCARKNREDHPNWAKVYYDMAMDELRHAENLYSMAEPSGERTHLEQAYIDDLRGEYAECAAHVRAMAEMYRNGG